MNSIRPAIGNWAARFTTIAVLNGAAAAAWTIFMVWPWLIPAPSMIIAGGSAGTWLLFGYLLFIIIGVVAVAVTALFYYFIEEVQGKAYLGIRRLLAWGQLVLTEVGVVGATFLMMYGGYLGGKGLLATSEGGEGLTAYQVHVQILQYYIDPVFGFVLIAVVGFLLGGLGYFLGERRGGA